MKSNVFRSGFLSVCVLAAGASFALGVAKRVEAQVQPQLVVFPGDGGTSGGTSDDVPVLKPVKAKCYFSPMRAMSLLLSNEIVKDAQSKGYSKVKASVSFKMPRIPTIELKAADVEGIDSIVASTPLNYTIKETKNTPADIGCAMEVTVFIKVSGVTKQGLAVNGKTSQKLTVRGAFK